MATFSKFDGFIERVFEGEINCATDQFKVALSNTLPLVTNNNLADITQIAPGNGYVTNGNSATVTFSGQISGNYTLVLTDVAFAFSGSVGPFQYAILYDDTHASKALVGWVDYTTPITREDGEVFVVNFDQAVGAILAS